MSEDPQIKQMRGDWTARQQQLGNLPRAVLMKGLHPLINETIDAWHRDIMRAAFAGERTSIEGLPTLDLGCGYGRLADQAKACGLAPLIGLDFIQKFCVGFEGRHGPAVCAGLSGLPFADGSLGNAYSVTSLMYLSTDDAARALAELDRCLAPGARILVLEPSREFNDLIRMVLRQKRNESLTRPGFTLEDMHQHLPPAHWRYMDSGSSVWMTAFLPLLVLLAPVPGLYRWLSRQVLRMDRPARRPGAKGGRYSMYRWVAYRKP